MVQRRQGPKGTSGLRDFGLMSKWDKGNNGKQDPNEAEPDKFMEQMATTDEYMFRHQELEQQLLERIQLYDEQFENYKEDDTEDKLDSGYQFHDMVIEQYKLDNKFQIHELSMTYGVTGLDESYQQLEEQQAELNHKYFLWNLNSVRMFG